MQLERNLPDWIQGWLTYMQNNEAPTLYHEWCAVSMIASVLERKCYLQWDKKIYPNFYIVLVGDAGCRKGTAMSPARELLEKLQVKIAADATSKEKLVHRLQEAGNTNYEALNGEIFNYAALTIFSEEFTVFLGYNNSELMQWLADWYDCKNNWKYETKHQGINSVEGVWVNLMGATTPELLQGSLPRESFGGGLNSRIIYVYASPQDVKMIIFPHHIENDAQLLEQLEYELEVIKLTSGQFTPDATYEREWEKWYPISKHIRLGDDRRMAGYMNRRGTHLHKLAMIMNASRGGGMLLTGEDFKRAMNLLERTEQVMAKTFEGVGKSSLAALMTNIVNFTRVRGAVQYSELLRHFHYDADEREFSVALATLSHAQLIKINRDPSIVKNVANPLIEYIETNASDSVTQLLDHE